MTCNNENSNIINFINKSGIYITNINELNGYIVERNILMNHYKIKEMEEEIKYIRDFFRKYNNTSLQIAEKQRWPLLNLVRQVFKNLGFKMIPFRKSNGYDINKKKKFIRYFRIEKLQI
jgi:hypothetical protein